jgi:predicted transport protein
MKLFKIENDKLSSVSINQFSLEKEIQELIEKNVNELFELDFVKSELRVQNFRFDTLCFDKSSNSFVIIEYKRGTNYSVIDQGYTYLSLLLNNKSDFILEYNETTGSTIKRDEVDWSQSRIIFISPKFSDYQKTSINFKNVPFELWEITRFKNELIGLNQIITESDVDINSTVNLETNKSVLNQVSNEIIKLDENYHLNKSKNRPEVIYEMYKDLKEKILGLGENVEIKIGKQTIGFKQNRVFTDLIIYNKGIGIVLNLKRGELNDFQNLTEDISEKGHWGNGEYRIWINTMEEIDYGFSLIKQSYKKQSNQ